MSVAHAAPPPPPRWVVDLNSPPAPQPAKASIPDPPGYTAPQRHQQGKNTKATQPARKPPSTEEMDTLKLKKAWELAIAPAKQLPMNAIGMYMSGNSLQIFSIMMVFMLFKNPVNAVININRTFANFETPGTSSRLLGVKLVFVATNCLALALGIWKVNKMGLLPTTRSDWLAWESERLPLERAQFLGWGSQ
ncbi:hypothetical protein BFW01_g1143 [Lasiodiplodia theobromae]|uniref:ER membrane protein complex subunit 4 n=2 Tax=Lasiodiplodia TaxID=66739 RepID=A0A5N5DLY2_9PEZI|nr:ER membrane duf1077 domain protein [Lasiodiplodia theobromae]KAB2578915.1 ER membrane protein complex subunit 4 [Lasiodiplodia theobromae]KAF4546441.1 ER membrane duf1077 domain protein [Lasiodiplodia theobromae]KAF9630581.1 hypothetical protein BFW01_g1143 [Lasiodiplodia theobromae]KAK0653315.1 ER membrane protein complex subunit 4 [Lasiodiplodia hormozganensis]